MLVRTLRTLCELTCFDTGRQNDGFSDTPHGSIVGGMVLTPRRVALAAAEACWEGLLGLLASVREWN